MSHLILCGDALDVLREQPAERFDAVLCDPPYGISFMGRRWDHGVPSSAVWEAALQTLRPGAPLLAFGGTRTYHRLAVAIEDAGAEISDSILCAAWITGQGFPKSLDISKAIDREAGAEREVVGEHRWAKQSAKRSRGAAYGEPNQSTTITAPATPEADRWEGYFSALKPAWEPVVCAWKPRSGTYAENALEHGVGGWNVDGGRLRTGKTVTIRPTATRPGKVFGTFLGGDSTTNPGRYPPNFILQHHPDCRQVGERKVRTGTAVRHRSGGKTFGSDTDKPPMDDAGYADPAGEETVTAWRCVDNCPVAEMDRQSGNLPARPNQYGATDERSASEGYGSATWNKSGPNYGDTGGASRFFYQAKASSAERSIGLEWSQDDWPGEVLGHHGRPRSRIADRWVECDNHHPTVKPIDLCRYLATLILPPPRADGEPRRLLVPFCGSGSEMIGALLAGWDEVVGIDSDPVSVEIARTRLAWWTERMRETGATDPQTIIEWGKGRPAPEARFRVSGPLFDP